MREDRRQRIRTVLGVTLRALIPQSLSGHQLACHHAEGENVAAHARGI